MKLTKYEKETIINFNEGEKEASIYTFNASLKRRLAEFAHKYPALCRLECSTAEGSVSWISRGCPSGFSRRTARSEKLLPVPTQKNTVFRF